MVGISTKDPSYHYDGIATSSVSLPNSTGTYQITTEKVLYHSARLHSLIELTPTKTVRIYFEYPASANAQVGSSQSLGMTMRASESIRP